MHRSRTIGLPRTFADAQRDQADFFIDAGEFHAHPWNRRANPKEVIVISDDDGAQPVEF